MKSAKAMIAQLLVCPLGKGCNTGDVSSEPVSELTLDWGCGWRPSLWKDLESWR